MRLAKVLFTAMLAVTLAAYAFDCGGMTSPDQAMECCKSMPCSSAGRHGQDCCKTMPAMHSPFVQPSLAHCVSQPSAVIAAVLTSGVFPGAESSAHITVESSHGPPFISSLTPLPLRI